MQPASTRPATGSSRVPSTCTARPLSRTSPGCVPATPPRRRAPRSRGTRTWRPRVTSGSTPGCEAQVTPRTEPSRAAVAPGTFPGRRPLPGPTAPFRVQNAPVGGRPWGTRQPLGGRNPARRPHPHFLLGALRLVLLPWRISLRRRRGAPSPPPAPHLSSRPFSFKYLSAAPARAGDEAVCLVEEGWGLQRIAIRVSPLPFPFPPPGISALGVSPSPSLEVWGRGPAALSSSPLPLPSQPTPLPHYSLLDN